ncbi:XRE family transcriptional regulator [Centipeda periodontii DSM 2778]|uniref:XRE family transcriptional regulator n=1 Tax=Centipeda periodontii DSM 2778 TaxID=888060 RepID=F5RPQ4_9FIRM|nr:XRE family transcriptional regulator [Centipeda periodontii DSM 2778]
MSILGEKNNGDFKEPLLLLLLGIKEPLIKQTLRLAQIFCPIEEANRTHSQSYVEDLQALCGQKRCAKMAVLNLSVLPQFIHRQEPFN